MKIGDLVRVKLSDSDRSGRNSGLVLKFDSYEAVQVVPDSCEIGDVIPIVKVLWSKGSGWIDMRRVEVISGNW
jgi:hypothetical protein|tara:strand:+ start:412 stop:630 length:219 start_codon:yes stop_codon:yes gene_type:complete